MQKSKIGRIRPCFKAVPTEALSALVSYALRRSLRPNSVDSRAVLRLIMTGAQVSWLSSSIAIAITPPAIMTIQKAQRQPISSPTNPPAIGPATGPMSGPRAHIAVALPRWWTGNRSAITPAPRVRQPDPPTPAKKRHTTSVAVFCASAHPICHITKNQLAQLNTIRRPYISLSGARRQGPN